MHKAITINGNKITYGLTGKGNPVVLLHGFGEDNTVWKNQVEALQDNYCVIVPDLPGSGQSDMIEDMSMEGFAAGVNEILKQESINSCVMIGHSMGGYVTLAFAEHYTEKLKGFGLFHSTAYADTEEKKETRKKGIRFIFESGAAAFLKTSTPNLFSPATKQTQPSLIEGHIKSIDYFSKEALIAYYQSMINRADRTQILKESKVPVLFIFGEQDTAVPLQDGLKQCHLPSVSYVDILQQSGHMGMYEEPERSNNILKQFLPMH